MKKMNALPFSEWFVFHSSSPRRKSQFNEIYCVWLTVRFIWPRLDKTFDKSAYLNRESGIRVCVRALSAHAHTNIHKVRKLPSSYECESNFILYNLNCCHSLGLCENCEKFIHRFVLFQSVWVLWQNISGLTNTLIHPFLRAVKMQIKFAKQRKWVTLKREIEKDYLLPICLFAADGKTECAQTCSHKLLLRQH